MPSRMAAPARPTIVGIAGVDLQDAELPLHEQDAGLDRRLGPQRQVGDPLDGQAGCDLDDERVVALDGRVAAALVGVPR